MAAHSTPTEPLPSATHAEQQRPHRPVAGLGVAGDPRPSLVRNSPELLHPREASKSAGAGGYGAAWLEELAVLAARLRASAPGLPHTAILRAPRHCLDVLRLSEEELMGRLGVVSIQWEEASPWRQRRHPRLLPALRNRLSEGGVANLQAAVDRGDWGRTAEGHPLLEYFALRKGEYEWVEAEEPPGTWGAWSVGTLSLVP